MNNTLISFIIPSRNNLRYLKHAYNSIRQNLNPHHEICIADDASTDGTWEWMVNIAKIDKNVKIHRNLGPTRQGHTILYDVLALNYATKDIICIFHADMYAAKGMDEAMLKYLGPKTMVSATRIEPPLHPAEPNIKIIKDFGIEPIEFMENDFNEYVEKLKHENKNKTSMGVFAPWLCYKNDFKEINGHDPLYAPQSKEDDDLWNRFMLNGGKFIQTWEGFVYHLTCRGSRMANGAVRNPEGQVFMKNRETDEWLLQNAKSTRNFIRKWGFFIKRTEYGHPQVLPKYDIGFIVKNCSMGDLFILEPWCSNLYMQDGSQEIKNIYMKQEQPNTLYDLDKKIISNFQFNSRPASNSILIEFDCKNLNNQKIQVITQLSEIIKESGDLGEFELECFKIKIRSLNTFEKNLIISDKSGKLRS